MSDPRQADNRANHGISRRQFGLIAAGSAITLGVTGMAHGGIVFPETQKELEVEPGQALVQARFLLVNSSNGSITVIRLHTSGKGVSAQLEPATKTLKPGDHAEIIVTAPGPHRRSRVQEHRVTVVTDQTVNPEVELVLRVGAAGFIEREARGHEMAQHYEQVMKHVTMEPSRLNWEVGAAASAQQVTITIDPKQYPNAVIATMPVRDPSRRQTAPGNPNAPNRPAAEADGDILRARPPFGFMRARATDQFETKIEQIDAATGTWRVTVTPKSTDRPAWGLIRTRLALDGVLSKRVGEAVEPGKPAAGSVLPLRLAAVVMPKDAKVNKRSNQNARRRGGSQ